MTRFTRCESSPPSPVIVVRSVHPCSKTAPEKTARKDRKEALEMHRTSTRRVLEMPREGSLNTHRPPCRDSSGRAMENEHAAAAQRGVAGSDNSALGQSTRGSPSRWHGPRCSTTARRSGGATRRPMGTESRAPKSLNVLGAKVSVL